MSRPTHYQVRPEWDCQDCPARADGSGEPWPCAPGRARLLAECGGSGPALRVLMWAHLDAFCLDAPPETLDAPFGAVYGRFIGWARQP